MSQRIRRLLALCIFPFLFLAAASPAGADIEITDIGMTWAKTHIESLVIRGIVQPRPDGTFRPNDEITRAEFAQMAHAAFSPAPKQDVVLTDVQDHPHRRSILALARAGVLINENSSRFLPDQSLTRAELFHALIHLLDLGGLMWSSSSNPFNDVDDDHFAYHAIQTAHRLQLLPPYIYDTFLPALPATRAEAAAAIDQALMLGIQSGLLDDVHPTTRTVTVVSGQDRIEVQVDADIPVFRNGQPSVLANIQAGDAVRVISDRFGTVQLIIASGVDVPDQSAADQGDGIRGYITPSDLRAILTGDWTYVRQSVKDKLADELVQQGIGEEEAMAVVERDWNQLQKWGQSIVVSLIQSRLGVSETLAHGIVNGDWTSVKEQLVEEEVVDRIIEEWLLTLNV